MMKFYMVVVFQVNICTKAGFNLNSQNSRWFLVKFWMNSGTGGEKGKAKGQAGV